MTRFLSILVLFLSFQLQAQELEETAFWHHEPIEIESISQTTLLVFTGSDWCRNCMKLHESVLENEAFTKGLDGSIYPLIIDLPRNKKNQEEETIREKKIRLAEAYNPQGQFPFIVLVNSNAEKIASTAYLSDSPQDYLDWVYSFLQKP